MISTRIMVIKVHTLTRSHKYIWMFDGEIMSLAQKSFGVMQQRAPSKNSQIHTDTNKRRLKTHIHILEQSEQASTIPKLMPYMSLVLFY